MYTSININPVEFLVKKGETKKYLIRFNKILAMKTKSRLQRVKRVFPKVNSDLELDSFLTFWSCFSRE